MFAYYVPFRSMTAAQHAVSSLQKSAIPASLVRMPQFASPSGCGYAVRFDERDWKSVNYAFLRDGITFSKVFRVFSNGKVEEV